MDDFIVMSLPPEVDEVAPAKSQFPYALTILALMIALMVTGMVPNVIAALIACLLMGLFRCVDMASAYKSIHWQSLILIAGMIPFAHALQTTGGVNLAVDGLMQAMQGAGARMVLGSLFVLTAFIGLFISNINPVQTEEAGAAYHLKVDVEGAELDILKAGHTLLRECVALKVECSFLPQRIDQPLVWAVAQFLAEAGFEVMDLQDFHRWRRRNLPAHPYRVRGDMQYSKGQVAQCDLVLLKTAGRLEGPEQAMRLVVLSAALGFFDHARTVLAGNPEWAAWVRETHGFDIDAELRQWSATVGSRVVRGALRAQVRGLVPLLRAWAGRFQFPRPD